VRQLFYAACFFEAGLLLIVLPWTVFWDRNYLLEAWPAVHAAAQSPFVRGAVSGLGVLNVGLGIAEVANLIAARLEPTEARHPGLAPPTDLR
jgi:hypothetical protein